MKLQKKQELKRKLRAKQKAEQRRRVKTPDPITGRKHIDVQTDLYLEELSDKVPEAIAIIQTDAFLNRAPSPLYIPQKSGMDVATQIYEGDLFDFDVEVNPILEVIVGKTIEQALMEVQEEEELAALSQHQVLIINTRKHSKTSETLNSLRSSAWKTLNVVVSRKRTDVCRNSSEFSRKSKKSPKLLRHVHLLKATCSHSCLRCTRTCQAMVTSTTR
jgi:Radial spoke protein 3